MDAANRKRSTNHFAHSGHVLKAAIARLCLQFQYSRASLTLNLAIMHVRFDLALVPYHWVHGSQVSRSSCAHNLSRCEDQQMGGQERGRHESRCKRKLSLARTCALIGRRCPCTHAGARPMNSRHCSCPSQTSARRSSDHRKHERPCDGLLARPGIANPSLRLLLQVLRLPLAIDMRGCDNGIAAPTHVR